MTLIWDILYMAGAIITIIMKYYVIKLCIRGLTSGIIIETEYGKDERRFIRWF